MKLRQKKIWVSLALLSLVCLVGSASATNLVLNGGFELGNVDFTSAYGYVSATGHNPNTLGPEGFYAIGSDPYDYHSAWTSFGPQSGDLMMIVNGAPTANVNVWSQTVTVAPDTHYYFSAYVASNYPANPAQLDFSINNVSIGNLTASGTPGLWQLFYANWNSGGNTTAALSLVNTNIIRDGNDFSLDNIKMDTVNPNVPVPSTVLLLGSGLVGLGLLRRKWSLKK